MALPFYYKDINVEPFMAFIRALIRSAIQLMTKRLAILQNVLQKNDRSFRNNSKNELKGRNTK